MVIFRDSKQTRLNTKMKKSSLIITAILILLLLVTIFLGITVNFSLIAFSGLIVLLIGAVNYKYLFPISKSGGMISITEETLTFEKGISEPFSNAKKVISLKDEYLIYLEKIVLSCRKDSIIAGSEEEFEKIFKDKIVKYETHLDE